MGAVNSVLNTLFDLLCAPLARLNPWWAMAFLSLLTGLLMLLVFRFTSNQQGIRRTKDRIKGHLLEFRLFKDSLGVTLQAFGNILVQNLRYLGHALKPLLVMIIPLLLILAQLNARFGYRPLRPGEQVLLKVKLIRGMNPLSLDMSIVPSSGFAVETPPLRIEEESEIDWRLRAVEAGRHSIVLRWPGQSVVKTMDIGPPGLSPLAPLTTNREFFNQFFNPADRPLPKGVPLDSIELMYPGRSLRFLGMNIHWLLAFFVLSLIFGFSLKGLFKVEF
ncbi:MAG: hypothetical protein MUP19_05450 [Candidatus Aminicenantes bacterium]|nr:hypothetical protein [Candidatus Aminicenantes bacterium]